MAGTSQSLTVCCYAVPNAKKILAALQSALSSDPGVQLFLPTSEAELLESPLFGHIDICLMLFSPSKMLSVILTNNPIQWIHSFSTGVATYMSAELAACPALMTNSKGLSAGNLVEFVFAATLHFAKHGEKLQDNRAAKVWDFFEMSVLYGKTMLILGYGNIGQAVGRMASTTFQMHVIALKRTPCPCDYAEEVYGLEALPTLLPRADVVVMCLPYTASTHEVLSTAELALLRSTAILINIGRGNQVDESALIAHLQAHKIAGAALDVTAKEPLPTDDPLWQCPNLLLSPHCACLHEEMAGDAVEQFIEELQGFRQGKLHQSKRLVDKKLGY